MKSYSEFVNAASLKKLEGKVAIVTGTTSGIGVSILKLFAAQGAKVVGCGRREKEGRAVVKDITDNGGDALFISCDVTDADQINSLIEHTVNHYGTVDILVNNAGTQFPKAVVDYSIDEFDQLMDINIKGPWLCMKAVTPVMAENGSGVIINVTSIGSRMASAGSGIYAPAKAALAHMTRIVALELASKGIRVNELGPGVIATPLLASAYGDDAEQKIAAGLPLKRCGDPDDVANAALFLASDDASYITAESLFVSGGRL